MNDEEFKQPIFNHGWLMAAAVVFILALATVGLIVAVFARLLS